MVGLAAGLAIGAFAGLLADLINGKIYNRDKISKELPYPLLADLSKTKQAEWEDTLFLLRKNFFIESDLAILGLGNTDIAYANRIVSALNSKGDANTKFCRSLIEAEAFKQVLVVAEDGSVSNQDLEVLVNYLKLKSDLIAGWVWLPHIRHK